MGVRRAVLETIDLEEHRDTAIETGHYTLKADGGAIADHGKYIVIWNNEGGMGEVYRATHTKLDTDVAPRSERNCGYV